MTSTRQVVVNTIAAVYSRHLKVLSTTVGSEEGILEVADVSLIILLLKLDVVHPVARAVPFA